MNIDKELDKELMEYLTHIAKLLENDKRYQASVKCIKALASKESISKEH